MERYENVIGFYKAYMGEGTHLTLFWCAMLLLVILALRENDLLSKKLVVYVGLISIIYWNPITSEILLKYLTGHNVYCRMFWLFPISIVIAYAITYALKHMNTKKARLVVFGASSLIIATTGKYMFSEEYFTKANNTAKLPNSTPEICHIIENDATKNSLNEIRVIVEDSLVSYIRQYDGNIKMNYGRISLGYENEFRTVVNADDFEINKLLELANKSGTNYLVLYSYKDVSTAIQSGNCIVVGAIGEYVVYRVI